MTSRRPIAALTAGTLAASALAVAAAGTATTAAAAIDSTPGYSVRTISVDVLVGPKRDQPCTIVADLYRPDGATAKRRAPAILTTHGFGGSKDNAQQRATARGFVQEGYVVLSYSGLGFGGSTCKIHLDDPDWDGRAGKQMVSVLAGTKPYTDEETGKKERIRYVARDGRRDPRVGMIGGSYGGQIQYAVAMQDKRVDALIPLITWHDLAYSLAPNNSSLRNGVSYRVPGVHKRQWTDVFFSAGVANGGTGAGNDPDRNAGCPNFTDQACASVAELHAQGYPGKDTLALARSASVATYVRRVKAPTLVVGGQADTLFNLQEATATFRALRRNGTEARMIWQSWGHSDSSPAPGELDLSPSADRITDSYLGRRFLAWMDRHVRGDRSAPAGPRFEYFRNWVPYDTSAEKAGRAVARAYARRGGFSGRPTETLFLSGPDALVQDRSDVVAGTASYANAGSTPTSYSETSAVEGGQVNRPPSDEPGTFVAYTTPALKRSTVLLGSPRLTVHLDAPTAATTQSEGPGGKLILFAKLYDVAPDGTQTLQHRLISPVRVPDLTKPVRIELPSVAQRFAKGHRIRLVIAASDAAYANNQVTHPVTVTTGPDRPGTLRLPLTRPLRIG